MMRSIKAGDSYVDLEYAILVEPAEGKPRGTTRVHYAAGFYRDYNPADSAPIRNELDAIIEGKRGSDIEIGTPLRGQRPCSQPRIARESSR
jgi:hypothetical protein